jgi:hypothetical protein
MAAEITQIDPQSFLLQTCEGQDINLISTIDINTSFSSSSYIEYFTYDNNQNILSSDYNFSQYTIQNDGQSAGEGENVSEIILDPEQILIDGGFDYILVKKMTFTYLSLVATPANGIRFDKIKETPDIRNSTKFEKVEEKKEETLEDILFN